jgi:potassium-dependent mechanosensitive channel
MAGQVRPQRHTTLILLTLLLLCRSVNGQSAAKPTPPPSPVASPNPLVIPVPQIAAESIQLNQRLRSLPDRIVSNESLGETEHQVNELSATTVEKDHETRSTLQAGAILSELEQLSGDWQAFAKEVKDLSERLTKQATALDNEIRSLRSEESRWSASATELRNQQAALELLDINDKVLRDLSMAIKLAEDRRAQLVTLQQSVAQQGVFVTGEIENLKREMEVSQRSLLEADSPPLWKVQFGSQSEDSLARLLQRSYASDLKRLKAFITTRRTALTVAGLITLSALFLFVWLDLKSGLKTTAPDQTKPDQAFSRPVSLALLVGIVATMPLFHDAPRGARSLLYLIGIVPAIRLLKPRLTPARRQILIGSIISLLVWQLIIFLRVPLWLKRDLVEIFIVLVVSWFAWLTHKARQERAAQKQGRSVPMLGVYLANGLLVVAFMANLFGYVGLSDLLVQATLASAYRAVALYTIVVIGSLLISSVLQAEASQRLASVRAGGEGLVRRLSFVLALLMLLVWIHQTLNLFAIRQDVYEAIGVALNYQFKIGSATLAVSSVVAFILTLVLGYLVATVLRVILGKEILPRLKLSSGLPNAIATITHYVLLVLIFLLALAAAGVELSKFTILTGALGVGLGFGLQNVVNNFVSGLILLFERPVRIGDLLEIGGVSGAVTKIGFRSSTLHAFDGSDLIIPNATLISQQVVNWTLTGTRRRVVLNIPVAYGNDPTQVRDLLCKTMAAHPEVLRFPVPMVLFHGFGNNALNFEIRFWAPRPEILPELKSDVALNIAAALSEAGIEVPIPQVHIRTTDQKPAEAATAAINDGG